MKTIPQAVVNWTKVLSNCSPTVRKTILETRALHEDLRRQLAEAKESVPKLDFAAYRAALPKSLGKLVDDAEKEVKGFKVPEIDTKVSLSELKQEQELKVR